ASRIDAATASGKRPLLEPAALLIVLKRRCQLVELADQDRVEVVDEQVDPVILDALLLEVVGADLLCALTRPHLCRARCGDLRLLLGKRTVKETRAEHSHRALAILK